MAATLLLEVATPERLMLKENVSEVEVPGAEGEMGILPSTQPLLSELGAGPLRYTPEGERPRYLFISGGWVEVNANAVRVLANTAEHGDDIDIHARRTLCSAPISGCSTLLATSISPAL